MTDITVVVTAHSETAVAGPTMRSAERAVRAAESSGFSVERIVGLDAATDECRDFFSESRFPEWRRIEFSFAELGRVRNAIAELAAGRWIAFLDADDLFSENWLTLAATRLSQSDAQTEKIVVHPELNWFFDNSTTVQTVTPQDDSLFSPYYLYFSNYYDSLCMAPRSLHLEVPYVSRDIRNGLSYQDWQWNIATMGLGAKHVVVRDTIVFKRRKDYSLAIESSQRRAIVRAVEDMAIDRIADLGTGGQKPL
jgi:hypothetical protein